MLRSRVASHLALAMPVVLGLVLSAGLGLLRTGPGTVAAASSTDAQLDAVALELPGDARLLRRLLRNLIENAADFATQEVRLRARWNDSQLVIEVMDDGPGFSAEIFEQIGEPYVTSRPSGRGRTAMNADSANGKQEGMGLGFFIAKTLLEKSGASVAFHNGKRGGAVVSARWPRESIEAPALRDLSALGA